MCALMTIFINYVSILCNTLLLVPTVQAFLLVKSTDAAPVVSADVELVVAEVLVVAPTEFVPATCARHLVLLVLVCSELNRLAPPICILTLNSALVLCFKIESRDKVQMRFARINLHGTQGPASDILDLKLLYLTAVVPLHKHFSSAHNSLHTQNHFSFLLLFSLFFFVFFLFKFSVFPMHKRKSCDASTRNPRQYSDPEGPPDFNKLAAHYPAFAK